MTTLKYRSYVFFVGSDGVEIQRLRLFVDIDVEIQKFDLEMQKCI